MRFIEVGLTTNLENVVSSDRWQMADVAQELENSRHTLLSQILK